jgi:hypothetical protein
MDYEADLSMPATLMEWIQQIGILVLGTIILSLIYGVTVATWEFLQDTYDRICHWFTLRRIAREERERVRVEAVKR